MNDDLHLQDTAGCLVIFPADGSAPRTPGKVSAETTKIARDLHAKWGADLGSIADNAMDAYGWSEAPAGDG